MSGYIIEFKKVFVKCTVPGCPRKHYAKGYCERHYHQNCRGEYKYKYNWEQYINHRINQKKHAVAANKEIKNLGIIIKNKTANALFNKITEAYFIEFRYKDVIDLTGWKYERVKKYILMLVKLDIIYPVDRHIGGKNKTAVFKVIKI